MEDESRDLEIVQRSVGLGFIEMLQFKSIRIFWFFQSFKNGRNVYWINDDIEFDRMYCSYTNGRTIFHAVVSFKPMIVEGSTILCISRIGVVPQNAGGLVALFRYIREISEFDESVDYMTMEYSQSDEEHRTLLKNGWERQNCTECTRIIYKCR